MLKLTILCQSTSFVTQQILDSAKILGYCTRSDHSSFDALVVLDKPCIDRFAHVEIDTQTDGHDCGKENQEAHHIDVPGAAFDLAEAGERDEDEGEGEGEDAEPFCQRVNLEF